ncbi:hypothetical protein C8J56DRAFT_891776 [Mycena floridula]|nr:hypothetical protein C8J56DRAFT_891776 [Mycena floridula]
MQLTELAGSFGAAFIFCCLASYQILPSPLPAEWDQFMHEMVRSVLVMLFGQKGHKITPKEPDQNLLKYSDVPYKGHVKASQRVTDKIMEDPGVSGKFPLQNHSYLKIGH